MKKAFTIIAVILFSIGGISATLIGYNYFSSPHVISKDQAITTAMRAGGWTQLGLGSITVNAKLLQAKLSNHVALVIDDTDMSMQSFPIPEPLKSFNVQDNQLFWEVTIDEQIHPTVFKQWTYEIDATNGTVIEQFTPNG